MDAPSSRLGPTMPQTVACTGIIKTTMAAAITPCGTCSDSAIIPPIPSISALTAKQTRRLKGESESDRISFEIIIETPFLALGARLLLQG